MLKQGWFFLILILLVALLSPVSAHAETVLGGEVIVGRDFSLAEGEQVNDSLIIMGGSLDMAADSRVAGNVMVTGGDAHINGKIDGNIVVTGGEVHLGSQAVIGGDVVIRGGHLYKATTAVIRGHVRRDIFGWQRTFGPFFNPLDNFGIAEHPPVDVFFALILWSLKTAFSALVGAFLAWVVVTLWPQGVDSLETEIQQEGVPAFLVGFVAIILLSVMAVVMIVSICLSLLGLAIVLLLLLTGLVGTTAIGRLIGGALFDAAALDLGEKNQPAVEAAVGMFLLVLLSRIPCFGSLLALVIGSLAVGALLLSWSHSGRYGHIER